MLIVILFSLVVILSFVKYIWNVNHMESVVKNVTTLKPWYPFIGNATFFMGKKLEDVMAEFIQIVSEHGSPLKAQIGPAIFVMLDNPEDVKIVLLSPQFLDKPYIYSFLNSPRGLVAQRSGDEWKPVRKIMNPMFNLKKLQSFFPILNQKALNLVKELENEMFKSDFDVMKYASVCTLSSVCGTIMDFNLDLNIKNGHQFIHDMNAIFDGVAARLAKPWNHLEWIYRWSNLYVAEQKHWANLRQLINRIFKEQTNKLSATNNNTSVIEKEPQNENLPFKELYDDGNLSDTVIKEQIETLLIAGNETTAATISFAILMLAMHSNIQEYVFNEMRSVYETQDEETTNEHILKLDILDRVIKETMRLFPAAPIIGRTSTVDLTLSECTIPKGATIAMPIFTLHRRRDVWGDDADSFNPDRFLPEYVKLRHPFAFLPFSTGQRNCIGYQYAMFSMKVMLSAVLRHYKFTTNLSMSDLTFKFEVSLKLTNKHMVALERRVW